MSDYIPELLTLKDVLVEHKPLQEAFFKTRINEKITSSRLEEMKAHVFGTLKKYQKLSFEVLNLLPKYERNSDEFLLAILSLHLLRSEKKDISSSFDETVKKMRLLADSQKDYSILSQAAKTEFEIPEELKNNPYIYNSLLFEMPEFLLRELQKEYSREELLPLIRSLRGKAVFYYGSETKQGEIEGMTRIPLSDDIILYQSKTILTGEKQKQYGLYPTTYLENKALSKVALPSLSPNVLMTLVKNPTSFLPLSYLMKESYDAKLTPVFYSSIRYRMAVDLLFERKGLNFVKPLYSKSSFMKTYLPYESYDLVFSFVDDSQTSLTRKRVEVLPSFDKKAYLDCLMKEKKELEDSFPFVKKGGLLLYLSHSILKQEGQDIIQDFLNQHKDFILEKEENILESESEADGGYYAILRRCKE